MKLGRVMAEEWGGGDLVSDSVGGSGKKRRMGKLDTVQVCKCASVQANLSGSSLGCKWVPFSSRLVLCSSTPLLCVKCVFFSAFAPLALEDDLLFHITFKLI